MTEPFAAPAVLIDERNRYTELSLDRLFYAVQWKDHLLLAGGSGIFDYDARLHSWKRQAAETISAIGPCALPPPPLRASTTATVDARRAWRSSRRRR